MGSVYLGRHNETGQIAAVKVLPAALAREDGFVTRFGREIESMQKFRNPHIVRLYDHGEDNGTHYYSMEYVPGETLTALLRREKRLGWQQTINFAIQICRALKAAHDAGVIHRDLKPSNLLISPDGDVKLTDFGVAQLFATDRLTVTGGIVGTAEFMSPEQAQGKRATKQSDLYSLGAVMYAMVAGRPPFTGSNAIDVLQKHKFGRFDPPRLIVPDLPHWLDEVICQLLEKDPAKRFPDALVLARKLDQVTRRVERVEGATTAQLPAAEGDETVVSEGGPGPATMMKHLVRQELEKNKESFFSGLFNNTWFLITLLILVVVGSIAMLFRGERTPEQKFAAGVRLLEQPASDEWVRAKTDYFEPLLEQDAATWEPQIAPYLRQIAQYELEQSTAPRSALRRRETQTTEAERLLSLARSYRVAGDWARAERTLAALHTLLEGDPAQAVLYEATGKLLTTWQNARAEQADRYAWVQAALKRAEERQKAGDAAGAAAIRQSIIDLYADDPAAASFVEQARKASAPE